MIDPKFQALVCALTESANDRGCSDDLTVACGKAWDEIYTLSGYSDEV
jgi:hypothetical protein